MKTKRVYYIRMRLGIGGLYLRNVRNGSRVLVDHDDLPEEVKNYLFERRSDGTRIEGLILRDYKDFVKENPGTQYGKVHRIEVEVDDGIEPTSPAPGPASPRIVASLTRRLEKAGDAARRRLRALPVPSPRQFFEDMGTPEGAFSWEDGGDGDWHYYCCGESDCEVQWHKICPTMDVERKEDGTLSITIGNTDSDGNHDTTEGIDVPEDKQDEVTDEWMLVHRSIAEQSLDYFLGNARYNLHLLEGGEDVLGDCYGVPTRKNLLRSVREEIKSIGKMGR